MDGGAEDLMSPNSSGGFSACVGLALPGTGVVVMMGKVPAYDDVAAPNGDDVGKSSCGGDIKGTARLGIAVLGGEAGIAWNSMGLDVTNGIGMGIAEANVAEATEVLTAISSAFCSDTLVEGATKGTGIAGGRLSEGVDDDESMIF